jgi:hypothetical protein
MGFFVVTGGIVGYTSALVVGVGAIVAKISARVVVGAAVVGTVVVSRSSVAPGP